MSSKKNILILYPGFPHYRDGIIEALVENGRHRYIFAGDKRGYNNIKPYLFQNSVVFYDLPAYRIGPFHFSKGAIKLALSKKIDGAIVHSSPYWISIIWASLIFRFRHIKVYNWGHGMLTDFDNLKNRFYAFFHKTFFDGMLLYGEIAKKNLIRYGYDEKKLNVIYNSLNYNQQVMHRGSLKESERDKLRSELFQNPENFQLIFIGRLTAQKKLQMLLTAVSKLQKEKILVNLLFVGDGKERESLQNEAKELEITGQIHFYGASYLEKTNFRLISSSDCCVAPGEVGLTAIHSLMYGVPVISHGDANNQMPEFEAIRPEFNGFLFEMGNIDDLIEKIKKTIEMTRKRTTAQIKENCYQVVDDYYNPTYQYRLIDNLF